MQIVHFFTFTTIIIYIAAIIAGFAGMIINRPLWHKAGSFLAILAFLCQTIALITGFHGMWPDGPSKGAYIQLIAWFIMLCGIGSWPLLRDNLLVLFAAPIALVLFLASLSSLDTSIILPSFLNGVFFIFHIGVLFLSLGFLCVAFISGLLFIFIQKRIKSKRNMQGVWKTMPALAVLDKINAVCSVTAFPAYTAGLIAGFFTSWQTYGKTFNGDPKEITSLFIWLLLAILFHNRLALGWKGRRPALLAILIFSLSLFSVLIVNFYFSTNHSF